MRPIKFRGKTTANGHWVYGSLIAYNNGACAIRNSKSEPWVDPSTVGQFTGLRDCTGKEIYEGDILERYNEHGITMHINYFGSQFGCVQHWDGVGNEGSWYPLDNYFMEQWEVIGNIHDNPELLNTESNTNNTRQ
ncbi:MAG: hypothetical protein JFR41_05900 [Muribaculaceae bacterium]|nr:hypothetical protein [Muribaculaceae bacterium]